MRKALWAFFTHHSLLITHHSLNMVLPKFLIPHNIIIITSGYSAAWLARLVRDEEVVGSSPTTPKPSHKEITMKKAPLIVAGLIFSFIALANLARSIWEIPVSADQMFTLEPWTGVIAFFVMSLLAIWMFASLRSRDGS